MTSLSANGRRIGRPPKCECGACERCRARVRAREHYRALSLDERRAWIARRDPEKMRAADRARYYRDHEKRLAAMRAQARANPAPRRAATVEWAERNLEKRRAQVAVGNAIRDGRLERQPCEVCGDETAEAHHDDYARPLDVRWLCKTHHGIEHRTYGLAA